MIGTCSMTYERHQVVGYSEWFKLIRATIGTAAAKPVKETFLVFKIFSISVSFFFILYFKFKVGLL